MRHDARVLAIGQARLTDAAMVMRESRMNRFELLVRLFWRQLPQPGETNRNFNNLVVLRGRPVWPDMVRKKREFLCYGL